ncbi:MAG TPA: cell wall anchor protein, partial [Verrucomicrobiales bacterium]|nr:cell wall anchor protein [Verrucomicrobiales bacterium]
GELYTWGNNQYGQRGVGHTEAVLSPVRLPKPDGLGDWAELASSGVHVLAADSSGRLFSWGANDGGQLGLGDRSGRLVPTPVGLPEGVAVVTHVAAGEWGVSAATTAD